MEITAQRWGDSLALRIPKALAKQADLKAGSPVKLTLKGGHAAITPVRRSRKYSLKELVEKITPANRQPEVDWGYARDVHPRTGSLMPS